MSIYFLKEDLVLQMIPIISIDSIQSPTCGGGKLLRIQQGWTCYTSLVPHCLKEPNLAYWVSLIRKLNVLKDNEWKNLRVFSILEYRETILLQVCSTKQLFSDLVSRATLPDSASLSFSLQEEWSPDFLTCYQNPYWNFWGDKLQICPRSLPE